jgi:peptidoglycan/LPS O-acetylase OafA/YrhL
LNKTESPHWTQLDGLRGLAVIAVVAHHYAEHFWHSSGGGPVALAAVRLFFVLSGFLITGILLRSKEEIDRGRQTMAGALRIFYLRRALRIFPLYYLTIAIGVAANLPPAREILPWLCAYLVNVRVERTGEWVEVFSHFWTLSVEEQFYLFWPLLIFCVRRRHLPAVIVATVVLPLLLRGWWLYETRMFALELFME